MTLLDLAKNSGKALIAYIPSGTSYFTALEHYFPIKSKFTLDTEKNILQFGDVDLMVMKHMNYTQMEAQGECDSGNIFRAVVVHNGTVGSNADGKKVLAMATVYRGSDIYGFYHIVEDTF
eukprot:TRINITY_DN180_c0_g1_i1.p2 TRINITY_DN180_c0_g1~~TRINITY_DN180_c0_g1_i1.p2  ORF type:complete len:120 (-),score=20.85 TRINITY_DN180_c0_g1_i1:67-426(-)